MSCPEALEPLYTTSVLNDPVILYEGELELIFNDKTYTGSGSIHLAWLPVPDLRFEMVSPDGVDRGKGDGCQRRAHCHVRECLRREALGGEAVHQNRHDDHASADAEQPGERPGETAQNQINQELHPLTPAMTGADRSSPTV